MSDDVLITPASRKIEFKDSAGNIDGLIQLDSSGNLVLTSTVGLLIGDLDADIHIGDGSSVVDMVFDWSGSIYSVANKDLTIGKSSLGGNDIIVDSPNWSVTSAGNATFAGDVTIAENKKIYFDSTDTYIYADTDSSEDLHIGADGHIELEADNDTIIKQGSTELARFTSTGLGIGTTSPGNILDVEESVNGNAQIRIENENSGGDANQASVGIVADGNNLSIASYGDSHATLANYNRITTSAGSAVISIDSGTVGQGILVADGGNVGIGTTTTSAQHPDATLYVKGGIDFSESTSASEGSTPAITQWSTDAAAQDLAIGARSGTGEVLFFTGNAGSAGDWGASSNAERMRITHDGKVGIGTTSPASELQVAGSILVDYALAHSGDSNNSIVFTTDTQTFNTNGAARITIKDDGRVGIGTSAPDETLHVKVTSGDSGPIAKFERDGQTGRVFIGSGNAWGNIWTDDTVLAFGTGNSSGANSQMVIVGSNVGIGTTSPETLLDIDDSSYPKMRFSRASSYWWEIGHTSSDFRFTSQTGGTIMHMNYDGNVGIGTTSPDTLFEIKEGGTGAAIMRLRNSNTSFPNDTAFGTIEFYNADSSGAGVTSKINAVSDASGRGGQLQFQVDDTGTSPQTALLLQGDLNASFAGNIRSESVSSYNTMAQYLFGRTSMGTGTVDLRTPNGGDGSSNMNHYAMPRAGKVMGFTLDFYGGTVTATGSDVWRLRRFDTSGTETTKDATIVRSSMINNNSNNWNKTVEFGTPMSFAAGDNIYFKRQTSGGSVTHVQAVVYIAFDL